MANNSINFASGTVVTSVWLNDVDTEVFGLQSFGAAGDGVTNDLAALQTALATGKVIDGKGLTYGITGSATVTGLTSGGLINATLKQLAPTTATCQTLTINSSSKFLLRNVTIDRGGSAGYTVGALGSNGDWAGLRITTCSGFYLENVLITNGGRGTGLYIFNSTDWSGTRVGCTEMYWQEVNPLVPVVVDDVVQSWWLNGCSRFSMTDWYALNVTSGAPGNTATGVATSQVRNFTRSAWSGCSRFTVKGCTVENVAQCYDFTGSAGNYSFSLMNCIATDAGVNAFKFANSVYSAEVVGCISRNSNQYGFLVSGPGEAALPAMKDIDFVGCLAENTGGLSNKYAGLTVGFAVEVGTFDTTYPRGVTFTRCSVIDRQGTPTTTSAFRINVSPILFPATGYSLPETIRCIECKIDVVGMSNANKFAGGVSVHHPYATVVGQTGTDSLTTSTWTNLNFDGTDIADPSNLHSTSSNVTTLYIKEDGMYVVKVSAIFPSNATGQRALRVANNNAAIDAQQITVPAHATQATTVNDTFMYFLYSGDTITMQGWQNSGGSLSVARATATMSLVKVF